MLGELLLKKPLDVVTPEYIEAKRAVVATARKILDTQGISSPIIDESGVTGKQLRKITVKYNDQMPGIFQYVITRVEPAAGADTFISIGGRVILANGSEKPLIEIQLPGSEDEVTKVTAEDDLHFDVIAYKQLHERLSQSTPLE